MQPIPYEPVAGSDLPSVITSLSIGVAAIAGGLIFVAVSKKMHGGKAPGLDEILGIITVFFGGATLALGLGSLMHSDSAPTFDQTYKQTEAVQKELKGTYGVKLSHEEAKELEYPAEAPKDRFKVFGSFEEQKQVEGKAFESRTVYLVWSDGSLGLSESSDGKSFTPLEPRA